MELREACLRILKFLYTMSPTNAKMVEAVQEFESKLITNPGSRWVCQNCQKTYGKPHDLSYAVKTICNNFGQPCDVCGTVIDSMTFDLTSYAALLLLRQEMENLYK